MDVTKISFDFDAHRRRKDALAAFESGPAVRLVHRVAEVVVKGVFAPGIAPVQRGAAVASDTRRNWKSMEESKLKI